MNLKRILSPILACAALFSLALPHFAAAADVNKLVSDCANCHGKDGASTDKDVPIIGGMSADYIAASMAAYKGKKRPCPEAKYRDGDKKGQQTDMCTIANDLTEANIKLMSEYFAGKKFIRAQQNADPALAKKGSVVHERQCEKCHSEGGSLASDDSGILAGQWMPYLQETFKEYETGKRPMDEKMKPKMQKLKPADVEALIQYYGSFK